METPSISLDEVWCARQRTPWPLQRCRVNEWSNSGCSLIGASMLGKPCVERYPASFFVDHKLTKPGRFAFLPCQTMTQQVCEPARLQITVLVVTRPRQAAKSATRLSLAREQ